jgi:hypothetical protein
MASYHKDPHSVWCYFRYDSSKTKQSQCLVVGCSSKLFLGQHIGNLYIHLKRFHKMEYELGEQKKVGIRVKRQQESQKGEKAASKRKRKVGSSITVRIDS